jgi:DNA-directed RNA polymerase specialized sigma24 family protein
MRNRSLVDQLKAADRRVERELRHLMEASSQRRTAAEKRVADGWSLAEIGEAIGGSKSAVAHMLAAARGVEDK